jgi:hypothetical protein
MKRISSLGTGVPMREDVRDAFFEWLDTKYPGRPTNYGRVAEESFLAGAWFGAGQGYFRAYLSALSLIQREEGS